MLWGRPTNLWLGFVTAAVGLASLTAVTVFRVDPIAVATLGGGVNLLLGSLISLLANQPPTLAPGDTFIRSTPDSQPNEVHTIR